MKTFHGAVKEKDFTYTAQLRLHQESIRGDVVRQAECLAPAVDAISVTDCPYGVLHMAGLAVSALLLQCGIDPILQISSRDRNRIALKSELLGASALGVTSIMLQRGDKLPKQLHPKLKQVFDTGAKRALEMGRQLSVIQSARGDAELYLGTLATVFDPPSDWQPTELHSKIDAGARFIQTQICMDLDLLRRYMLILVASRSSWRCHIVVSVPVLTSVETARWLYDNLRGSVIPKSVLEGFENARDPEQFGIDLCAKTIRAIREIPGVGGVSISTTGRAEAIVAAIDQATA